MKERAHNDGGGVVTLHPYVETIPGALTFLMAEFKKLVAERLTLETERTMAQEEVALLTEENAQLQRKEAALLRDVQMLEYALSQERMRTETVTPKSQACDAAVQVVMPPLVVPPAPPPPPAPHITSPTHARREQLQRAVTALESSVHQDSPRQSQGRNAGSTKKKRPVPMAGVEDQNFPFGRPPDHDAEHTTYAPSQSHNLQPHMRFIPHPKPKGKSSSGRPQNPRQPSPPPEHPVAKAPVRYPIELAADDSMVRSNSPPRPMESPSLLMLSPEPQPTEWALATPSPNHTILGMSPPLHDTLPGMENSALSDIDMPFDPPFDEDTVSLRLEYSDDSPKFPMHPSGSVLHMTRRNDDPTLEFDVLVEPSSSTPSQSDPPNSLSGATWKDSVCLQSHFDTVRCLAWHPLNAYLVTGSDDHTLKLWNLNGWLKAKAQGSNRTDLTPTCIYRGHTGPVTECCLLNEGVVSASCDSTLKVWHLSFRDPHRQYQELRGHTDAVWSVDTHPVEPKAISSSADGRVCLWDWTSKALLLQSYGMPPPFDDVPTCARWDRISFDKVVVAYRNNAIAQFDLETAGLIAQLDAAQLSDDVDPSINEPQSNLQYNDSYCTAMAIQVNKIAMHPTAPLCMTAHENGLVKLWDLNAGKLIDCLVCHEENVADVAIHPNGAMMATAGHGTSCTKIWDIGKRCLIEDIALHHSKHSDTALCVRWHGTKPLLATGGADSTVQVLAMR